MFRFLGRFAFRGPRTPRERALTALGRRDYRRAADELTGLLDDAQSEPPSPTERAFLLNKRGVAWMGLSDRERARTDFAAALECAGAYAPALTNLGSLLFEDGDVDGAIARYEDAVAADADYAVAYHNLGVAYKRAGRVDDAVRAMRRAMRLEGRVVTRPRRNT